MNVTDLLKCPECLYEGLDLYVRKKNIYANCPSCGFVESEKNSLSKTPSHRKQQRNTPLQGRRNPTTLKKHRKSFSWLLRYFNL